MHIKILAYIQFGFATGIRKDKYLNYFDNLVTYSENFDTVLFPDGLQSRTHNRQFGASGGVVSWDTSQEFGSFPPVRALPIPPPAAKLLKRYLSFWDSDTAQKKKCKTK